MARIEPGDAGQYQNMSDGNRAQPQQQPCDLLPDPVCLAGDLIYTELENIRARADSNDESLVRTLLHKVKAAYLGRMAPTSMCQKVKMLLIGWWRLSDLRKTCNAVEYALKVVTAGDSIDGSFFYVEQFESDMSAISCALYKLRQVQLMMELAVCMTGYGTRFKEVELLKKVLGHGPAAWMLDKANPKTKLSYEERAQFLQEIAAAGPQSLSVNPEWLSPIVPLLWVPEISVSSEKGSSDEYWEFRDDQKRRMHACYSTMLVEIDSSLKDWLSQVTQFQTKILGFLMTAFLATWNVVYSSYLKPALEEL